VASTRPGRDVEEPFARLERDQAQRLVGQLDLLRSHMPGVAFGDGVPGLRRRGVLVRRD
jgi:hypothetical protein